MKKFQFSLDTVLSYKEQVLDSAKNEHSQALSAVRKQEDVLRTVQENYRACQNRLLLEEQSGTSVSFVCNFTAYMDMLQKQASLEADKLARLRKIEIAKRERVIEMMKEKTSIEKLKEKNLEEYRKEEQKQQEHFIEEFVSSVRAIKALG